MEGVASLSLPGIFAVNPPALAKLPGRKSGRRSGDGHHPLLATELQLTPRVRQLSIETAGREGADAPPEECSATCNLALARRSRAAGSPRSAAEGRSIPEEGHRHPPLPTTQPRYLLRLRGWVRNTKSQIGEETP